METAWTSWAFVAGAVITVGALGFHGAPLWLWTVLGAGAIAWLQPPLAVIVVFAVLAIIFNVPPIRKVLVSSIVLKTMKALKLIPEISETERVALTAGDVWVEGELFSGRPDFKRLMREPYPELTKEEQAFLDGPVERVCEMVKDYEVWQKKDFPPEVWEYIKKERFLGMIIPKEYGGLGFSALAHSAVLGKLTSRSLPLCITVMVPNSLGPAELLLHYGTKAQKDYYLPRLARGEELPCFGLTEPGAGSDAGSITSSAVVFKGSDGKLQMRLNWNKRWITLAGVSTLIGLAFRLKDPDNLLGRGAGDLGITCALIPTNTAGITANRKHDPLGVPFYNCPTQGKDVIVPVEAIIGGAEMAGKGWKMLMECLAAGRGISLPAQATGGAKLAARVVSAHSIVRKQFGVSIGKFEGVEEPLARIGGLTYILEAARRYTLGGLDQGTKPPVVTAIAKYNFTEIGRQIINDAMDVQGGQAISNGPRNLLAHTYIATPIGITVEGANILTRTLIIFGQGALRAHPYAFKEVDAVEKGDLTAFDNAFWGHIGHIIRNTFRSFLLSVSRGYLASSPVGGPTAKYWRRLAWSSASFALMADLAMGGLGGKLKFSEKITGRFADILSWMYLITSTLRRFEAEGRRKEDLPFVHWAMKHGFRQITQAFDGLFVNLEMPIVGHAFRGPLLWYSRMNAISAGPTDSLGRGIAHAMLGSQEIRDRHFAGIYLPKDPNEQLAALENAFKLSAQSDAVASKVRKAVKEKKLQKKPSGELYRDALDKGVITAAELASIEAAEVARNAVIQVDDFPIPDAARKHVSLVEGTIPGSAAG